MSEVRKWMGTPPSKCQLCERYLKNAFIDGKLVFGTSWAIMCTGCHSFHGVGLGAGRGQKYDLKTLEKIEG